MLTDTLGLLGDGTTINITPDQGILLLEGWLNALPGDVGAERVLAEVGTLRDLLKSDSPNVEQIRHLLLNMARHTATLANEPTVDDPTSVQIKKLADVLRTFSNHF
ncbi:hypothetical protein [Spirosoma sp. KUDC1026]|uniref:hypothetical protein n=1 Tax=Spirosoma sp. KUDC1026 TaxID=2745947 RepID=UPI001E632971|nr:hypothetical protein [Spirosoma sp. KUDC1026]